MVKALAKFFSEQQIIIKDELMPASPEAEQPILFRE